jgi:hypothetical protein
MYSRLVNVLHASDNLATFFQGRYSRRSPSFSPSPQSQLDPNVYMQLRVQAGGQVTYEPLCPDGSTTGSGVTTAPPLPVTGSAPTVVEGQGRKVYSRALRFAPDTLSDEACLREVFTLPAAMALNLASLPNPPPGQPPHFPLPLLCALAIYGSPTRRLTISEIYQALEDRFQYYRDSKSWQVRFKSPPYHHIHLLIASWHRIPFATSPSIRYSGWSRVPRTSRARVTTGHSTFLRAPAISASASGVEEVRGLLLRHRPPSPCSESPVALTFGLSGAELIHDLAYSKKMPPCLFHDYADHARSQCSTVFDTDEDE